MKNQNTGRGESNIGRYIWLAIIVIVVLLMAFVLYDVNVRGNADKYGSLSGYLLFNDDWGTHREMCIRDRYGAYLKIGPFFQREVSLQLASYYLLTIKTIPAMNAI